MFWGSPRHAAVFFPTADLGLLFLFPPGSSEAVEELYGWTGGQIIPYSFSTISCLPLPCLFASLVSQRSLILCLLCYSLGHF